MARTHTHSPPHPHPPPPHTHTQVIKLLTVQLGNGRELRPMEGSALELNGLNDFSHDSDKVVTTETIATSTTTNVTITTLQQRLNEEIS